ncbi:hypothetical protein SAMN02745135_00073 [Caloranaerobacter azorensis DSM 13643]|uniref:Uncharacterized protein n=1 Tax=Caloranaerobacter azorensis DSM 13643 TaxID=1121264 RepID=A0A1M5R3S9_9FIRM|nr:hypothetical protein [Caloranaerobacter azorensis]SHH21044.1 hypothetical protein SAMN02745135_00073 [Caloranaerobacter azorensis DSM 13643]
MFKKVLSMFMVITIIVGISINVYANELPIQNEFAYSLGFYKSSAILEQLPELDITQKTLLQSEDMLVRENSQLIVSETANFKNMTVEELNQYISDISINDFSYRYNNYRVTSSPKNIFIQLKLAWLAAVQIAKLKGYTCAAKAVEYSVLGINYTENNGGLFRDKIVETSVYKNHMSYIKRNNKTYSRSVQEFTKSDNSDLFYALHNATFTVRKSGSKYNVNVYDVFDFDNKYDSLFTSIVNNWGWLSQNTGILNKIIININFKEDVYE